MCKLLHTSDHRYFDGNNKGPLFGKSAARPLLASQEENERPREDHTNPFAQPERTGVVRVHQKSQDQPGAKVEPSRRTTAPDRRAQAVFFRRRHQPRRPPLAKIEPGLDEGASAIVVQKNLAASKKQNKSTRICVQ
jgi:hypothetical protein